MGPVHDRPFSVHQAIALNAIECHRPLRTILHRSRQTGTRPGRASGAESLYNSQGFSDLVVPQTHPTCGGSKTERGRARRNRRKTEIFETAAAGTVASAAFPPTVPAARPVSHAEAWAAALAMREIWTHVGTSSAAIAASIMLAIPGLAFLMVVPGWVVNASRIPVTVFLPTP